MMRDAGRFVFSHHASRVTRLVSSIIRQLSKIYAKRAEFAIQMRAFHADPLCELPDFAARYREVAADLARARTYGADALVRTRLERLVAAGHNALYRDNRHTWRRLWQFVARECPGARAMPRDFSAAAAAASFDCKSNRVNASTLHTSASPVWRSTWPAHRASASSNSGRGNWCQRLPGMSSAGINSSQRHAACTVSSKRLSSAKV